jgi:nucleotide-binding universal stress UspA family protein
MSYATLMVHLELGRPNTALLKITAGLAERLKAAVIGIAVCQPMRILYTDGYVAGDIIEQDRQEIDDELKAAEAEIRAALAPCKTSIEWRSAVIETSLSEHLAKEARCADLVISGVDRLASVFDTSRHVDIGDVVMQAGRPCLIVPADAKQLSLDHVVIGWKETGETRRAVSDALPLLKVAGRVTVVGIAAKDDLSAAHAQLIDVASWLSRHGIDALPMAVSSTGDDAVRLSSIVQEEGGDLLVAGAYGHSRVREWVLGGVTQDLLLRGDRCTLVSH